MKLLLPITIFAASLGAIEWAGSGRVSALPLRTIAAAFASVWITRSIPWTRLLSYTPIPSRRFQGVLFFVVLGHFVQVLGAEVRRCFVARAQCTPRRFGPGSFSSLRWALVSTIERSLRRAERFYAAQLLKGL